ncbi:hypothetical protein B9Z55_026804 [Caenorhabditis nigoni]|uniref:F-box domain-containing protein n=1 Tax=Caenorhabditis nigoni TaxID=1611254 RepID=A0A2G5SI12_9PELO|nr:hypothetical protein B9Z55_026804 [Caenorhabditis nigoni]
MFLSKWTPWNFFSKNEKPAIMDMPYLVMTQILDNVGFLAIQNLRKTCKSFRNFIDDVKPNNELKKIDIFLEHHRLTVKITFDNDNNLENGGEVTVMYKEGKEQNCCLISKTYKSSVVEFNKTDGHFVDVFFHDFEPILMNQRSKLTDMGIKIASFSYQDIYSLSPQSKFQSIFSRCLCSRFQKFESVLTIPAEKRNSQHRKVANDMMNRFGQILGSRTVPFETKNLDLKVFKQSQIFGILRSIKTNSLVGNQAFQFFEEEDTQTLDAIPKCETLKNMEYLRIGGFGMTNSITDFMDIPELCIKRENISRNDITIVKQAFLTNSNLKKWQVNFKNLQEDVIIHEVLGQIPVEQICHHHKKDKLSNNLEILKKNQFLNVSLQMVPIELVLKK